MIVFASAALPGKLYEVAPHITKVGFGAQYAGGIAANKGWFDSQPKVVQKALKDAAEADRIAYHKDLDASVTKFLDIMKSKGATVTEVDEAFRKKWAAGMDNVAKVWAAKLDGEGKPGTAVLKPTSTRCALPVPSLYGIGTRNRVRHLPCHQNWNPGIGRLRCIPFSAQFAYGSTGSRWVLTSLVRCSLWPSWSLVNADVIGRGALNLPISGVPEMVSMSIVAIVFLQVAQAFRMGKLTRSDALPGMVERRSPRIRAAVESVFCISALFIMIQLMMASWPLFVKSWVRNTFEGTIGDFTAPIWPVKLVILIGCAMLIVQLIIALLEAFSKVFNLNPVDTTS